MTKLTLVVLGFGTAWLADAGQERPAALERLFRQRSDLRTGMINYRWHQAQLLESAQYRTGRFADEDNIDICRGDKDGVIGRSADGKTVVRGVRKVLKTGEDGWDYTDDGLSATLFKDEGRAGRVIRLRALGAWFQDPYSDIDEVLWRDSWKQPSERKYRESVEDGLHVVEAQTDYGVIKWWIDPKKDWSAVRVAFIEDGKIMQESRTELARFDGVWFPKRVECYTHTYRDGKDPLETFEIDSAEFNRPDHPTAFTPADLGIDAGVFVSIVRPGGGPHELVFWDGERCVSQAEFNELVNAGVIQRGPVNARALAELEAQQPGADLIPPAKTADAGAKKRQPFESYWEEYTRQFILRYKLDEAQRHKAIDILRDCQQQGRAFLRSKRTEIDKIDARGAAMRSLPPAERSEKARTLLEERAELLAPIKQIFERQLKPRLEKLPTRAQRAAADGK